KRPVSKYRDLSCRHQWASVRGARRPVLRRHCCSRKQCQWVAMCGRWGTLSGVRVGLLGPLLVVGDDGSEIRLGAPKERAVLAVLSLRAGSSVPAWELIDALWGEAPPNSAAKVIQTYVSSLRRRLRTGTIDTVAGGYRLKENTEGIDVFVFEQLVISSQQ